MSAPAAPTVAHVTSLRDGRGGAASVSWPAFVALMRRDLTVNRRELPSFLVRTLMQPTLFMIVFGAVLPKMGTMQAGYQTTLPPGILAISLTLSAIQSVALPMMQDFGFTKEIEDRLLAPISLRLVATQKIVSGVIQGCISALVVLPLARVIMGPIPGLSVPHVGALILITLLGASAFSSLGLLVGILIKPQQIGLLFSVIVAPMLFFGCAYYPWSGLSFVRVMQYGVLVNPLVYVAEGLRAVLTPAVPHMPLVVCISALTVVLVVAYVSGMRAFERKALG
jgi:ABC-2 type transport system permease protein